MITHLVFILLSLLLLFVGAEGLVRGSASVALRAGLSPLMVGLTIVAFGTSSPELVVSFKAGLAGQGDIALGNVVGSNSFNIGFILGLTALICPIPVHRQIIRMDAPIALGVAFLPLLFLANGRLDRIEAAFLFAGIVAYTLFSYRMARNETADAGEVPPPSGKLWKDLLYIVGGLLILVLGSRLLVDHSIALARGLGVSEAVIGLTIIAAGTSMPELATSLVAAIRKQPDIAVGNVIGSNIFNILGILGISGLVSPLASGGIRITDHVCMILFSLLLLPILYTGRKLIRIEGAFLLALYCGYLWHLWPKSV